MGENGIGYYKDELYRKRKNENDNDDDGIKKMKLIENENEVKAISERIDSDDDNHSLSSSSSSSTSSTTTSNGKMRKKDKKHKDKKVKKDKKEKEKKKKDKKEKKHKHKKDKKEKKEKHKKDKKEKTKDLTAIDQNKYGKYGIISEQHYFQKQREFELYMEDVKRMPGIFGQSKFDIMKMFKCYIEDYNTATMPHEKYYSIERWEMLEYQRKQNNSNDSSVKDTFNDEEERRMELKKLKEHADKQDFISLKQQMTHDRDRLEDMRKQSELIKELQLAYKQGNKEKVKSIESRLAPDVVTALRHPWT